MSKYWSWNQYSRSALCYCRQLRSFIVFDPKPFARFAKQLGRTTPFYRGISGSTKVRPSWDCQDLGFCLWAKTSKTSSWLLENIHEARACPELCESTGSQKNCDCAGRFRHSLGRPYDIIAVSWNVMDTYCIAGCGIFYFFLTLSSVQVSAGSEKLETRPLAAKAPKIGRIPKGNNRIPGACAVSFREGILLGWAAWLQVV